ncbi:hypothetical protein [Rugamonas sp.]|uniref:hypothetical protein n=1 Tax=Rugamonas sp. TaxID=1926287 RepID=UPI0025E8EAE3|nr:hypothetical protein [Rugamonas sp.]
MEPRRHDRHDVQAMLQLLSECPLPGMAPLEIHGAKALGYAPQEDYLFHGHKYVLDAERDVLVREDVYSWIISRRKKSEFAN